MPRFKMMFTGRPLGAQGKSSLCFASIEADTRAQALIHLYDKFEHISNLRTKDMSQEEPEWVAGW